LARANAAAATELAAAIAPLKPTSRQVGKLYAGWQSGTQRTRELIVSTPQIYLQALAVQSPAEPSATQRWLNDLGALGGIARRAHRVLEAGLLHQLLTAEHTEVQASVARNRAEVQRLFTRFDQESGHAG
jgi:hypothetical protein